MKKTTLRRLMAQEKILVAAGGSYDCLSAKLVEKVGFKATSVTGNGFQASLLGLPDVGLMTMTEMVNHAGNIAQAVNIPVLVDAEQGFGGIINMLRTVREFERAGIACISIQDITYPTMARGNGLVPIEEMVGKIKAALAAREDPDFVICARCEAGTVSMAELIKRCNAYAEAGADLVKPVLPQPRGLEQYKTLAGGVKAPMWLSLDARSGVTVQKLQELGITGVANFLGGIALMNPALQAMKGLLEEIKSGGNGDKTLARLGKTSADELRDLTGLPAMIEFEKRYSPQNVPQETGGKKPD